MSRSPQKVIILGAAGRDFHDFNVFWRDNPAYHVVGFTAAQIPDIDGRTYPPELSGPRYPQGVPIFAEGRLAELIREHQVDICSLAYSDLSHEEVMHKAALAAACGANFMLLGCRATMLRSRRPVIAVCAVRTGCGKSQTSRAVVRVLKKLGKKVAAIRHPMPYGDLRKQIVQRFATLADLDAHRCTIEEREEFEPHIQAGNIIYAGIDYAAILRQAESEAEVILWDGGNNDTPFFEPNLLICVTDPHRPGHEIRYYPGETNLRLADVVVVNKVDTAEPQAIETVLKNIAAVNPGATVLQCDSPLSVERSEQVRGKRVLAIEDGPTVTHGDMAYGAAYIAARKFGAASLVDPRPWAVGSIRNTFARYPHCREVLPAMGYGARQMRELEETINASDAELVLIGTPIDLGRMLKLRMPSLRVTYELAPHEPDRLESAIGCVVGAL
jgi:predicted GTPase